MKILDSVTLIGIDCINLKRLQLAADISTKDISFGAVKLLTSTKSDDPRVVQISHIGSKEEYSDFMIKKLDRYVDTDFALVFQYDGFVLNPSAWSDRFLDYDYIGSPWYHLGDLRVGNGGFSLRSKKLISWLAKNWQKVKVRIHPEDVFISNFARPHLEKAGIRFAPEDLARQFGKEGCHRSVVWNGEFGFHGLGHTDISHFLNKHPEYKEILINKLDDYATLMKKYPVYDSTVHTLRFYKENIESYVLNSKNQKNYEARITKDKFDDQSNVKAGDTIVFKRSGILFKDLSIPAFEKKVKKIERFNSFADLRRRYPKLHVTYPIKNIKKWLRPFVKLFGDLAYPRKEPYTVFWFA